MRELVLGSPGTGKTTTLLDIIDRELTNGTPPNRIAYVTFTRAGAYEARDRAIQRFKISKSAFRYFRTLHSLAYQQLGFSMSSVMSEDDFSVIGESIGMDLTSSYQETGNEDSYIRFIEEQARTRCISLPRAVTLLSHPDTYDRKVFQYAKALQVYKEENHRADYTDMISRYVEHGSPIPVDVFIVDEAQDLTPLQWRMVERASASADRIYYAGDDKQCVHAWGGSDVHSFLGLEVDKKRVLRKSYRLPRSVFKLADKIAERIHERYPYEWEPRDEEGTVQYVDFYGMSGRFDLSEGSWLFLARNIQFLSEFTNLMQEEGYFYTTSRGTYMEKYFAGITAWERLRKGIALPLEQALKALELLKYDMRKAPEDKTTTYTLETLGLEHMKNKPWFDALIKIRPKNRAYIQKCLSNGEKLSQPPRIKVSTIHGVKGEEADNVVVLPDMSFATYKEMMDNPDNEHRVFYVGVTRARHNLFLVEPSTRMFYEF